ncbi:MAG: acyltransferase [Hyphomonadaceae bacterium]
MLFHYRTYAESWGWASSLLGKGYLGVDFFFVLSGFVLARVYGREISAGTYRHSRFIVKRIARVYPMHIVMLAFFVALALAAPALGLVLDSAARNDFAMIPAHLLLVHAWIGTGEQFNFPSWSISAEFFAYLSFPVVMLLANRPRLMAGLGVAAVFGWYFGAILITGKPSTWLNDWQIMRIMPEFLLGAGLRQLMAVTRIPVLGNRDATMGMAALVIALALFDVPDWLMIAALIALLAAAAERARSGISRVLEKPFSLYLGEISYALYMVHIAVGMVWFELASRIVGPAAGWIGIALVAIGLVLATLAAAAAEFLIERPGRRIITSLAARGRTQKAPH